MNDSHRTRLRKIAHRVMLERGFFPDFSRQAINELEKIPEAAAPGPLCQKDLRSLPWCSIDNDDSLDLDQLTAAEELNDASVKIYVAIADVDALVQQETAINDHAQHNTTSIYTAAETFPMLPVKLSTNLTSLNFNVDRLAIVVEMHFSHHGVLKHSDIYQAQVRNHAKLAYNAVAAWLDEKGPMPKALTQAKGLPENLRVQDRMAQKLKKLRHQQGALDLETIEARPLFEGDILKGLIPEAKNRAKQIIEDFMIAANGITARFLSSKKFASLRRVVRTPKRWSRIVELANEYGFELPEEPNSKALEKFLLKAHQEDPVRFPDLSLSIIKLLGIGEYMLELPGGSTPGHFGLAVRDYAHSTAPNRRFPDLITQRLLKAALAGEPPPYTNNELQALARHCTEKEDDAKKVERRLIKSAAAILLENRIGEKFQAIVTGAAEKGTWVRLFDPPIEGRLEHGFEGVDVGQKIRVELINADVERGYIDFRRLR